MNIKTNLHVVSLFSYLHNVWKVLVLKQKETAPLMEKNPERSHVMYPMQLTNEQTKVSYTAIQTLLAIFTCTQIICL